MKWKLTVALACVLIVMAFAFIFQASVTEPFVLSMPYILWTGILFTALLVALTYIGSKLFPHKEK